MKEAGLTSLKGRIIYTDNYYTSMALAKHIFNRYGYTVFGTILPMDKKSRDYHDITFLKF